MSIFRGTGGAGDSTDDSIVEAVTEQAGIATTKAQEAADSATQAASSAASANNSASTATTQATEASSSATSASNEATNATAAKTAAETAQSAAEDARDLAQTYANTANNTYVQTVAGIETEVQNLDNIKTDITGVNSIKSDVTTVSNISSDVTSVAADSSDIGTVASNITNVNNVGNNIDNINAVHSNATNINTVAADGLDIGTVASNISDVNTVADISSDITTVSGLETKMDTVIADATDIGTVASNIGDVSKVAGIDGNVDKVAAIDDKVTTVADNIVDVQNAGTNAANASTSASQAANSAASAVTSSNTATTKATEASNSATAASNSATSASVSENNAADSASDSYTSAQLSAQAWSLASSRAFDASAFADAAALSATAADISADNAATSETNSETAAATWNSYYSTYLGAASSPPSTDLLGQSLQNGALYFNTTDDTMYVFNGSTWIAAESTINNVNWGGQLAGNLNTNGYDINFGANDKAQFGASNDLQIYHDGSNSYVSDTGYGNLILRGNSNVQIEGANGENCAIFNENSSVRLFYDNVEKLETTSTGIDVTGTVTASEGFAMGNGDQISSTGGMFIDIDSNNDSTAAALDLTRDGKTKKTARFAENGDISFYEDTGTTPKLFWDSSAEALRVGGSSAVNLGDTTGNGVQFYSTGINIKRTCTSSTQGLLHLNNIGTAGNVLELYLDGVQKGAIGVASDAALTFVAGNGSSEKMRIDSSGRVGIGTNSPHFELSVHESTANADARIHLTNADTGTGTGDGFQIIMNGNNASKQVNLLNREASPMAFWTSNSERMRIDSSGKVGIGTTSPDTLLNLAGDETAVIRLENTNGSASDGDVVGALQFYKADGSGAGSGVVGQIKMLTQGVGSGGHLTLSTGDANGNDVERLRVSSNGRVGIGTSSPNSLLHVEGTASTFGSTRSVLQISDDTAMAAGVGGGLTFRGKAATGQGDANTVFAAIHGEKANGTSGNNSGVMVFSTRTHGSNPAERMRIDSSGRVGIGTSSPSGKLEVSHSDYDTLRLTRSTPGSATILMLNSSNNGGLVQSMGNGGLSFFSTVSDSSSERARIDASGNLLVGKTSTTLGTVGIENRADGRITSTRSGNTNLVLNRLTSDGSLIDFYKDGTNVGSIGTAGNGLTIGNGDTGVFFDSGNNNIRPFNLTTNGSLDAAIDLGRSNTRFKNLYLSGGVYLGGTGDANKLDDYEEGTWTPNIEGSTTAGTFSSGSGTGIQGVYTKIGNLVTVSVYIAQGSLTGATGIATISGLPFSLVTTNPQAQASMVGRHDAITLATSSTGLGVVGINNSNKLTLRQSYSNGTNSSQLDVSSIAASGIGMVFTYTYRTA